MQNESNGRIITHETTYRPAAKGETDMTEKDTTILKQYTNPLSRSIQEQYAISPDHYRGDIKLGLRNNDGTGVLCPRWAVFRAI